MTENDAEKHELHFASWWESEGGLEKPEEGESLGEYLYRIAKNAWLNGAYIQNVLNEPKE